MEQEQPVVTVIPLVQTPSGHSLAVVIVAIDKRQQPHVKVLNAADTQDQESYLGLYRLQLSHILCSPI